MVTANAVRIDHVVVVGIRRRIIDEALFLLDTGVASAADIDSAVMNALGHPMGPFTLMDLTGIDLSYHVAMERYRETEDPADKPSPKNTSGASGAGKRAAVFTTTKKRPSLNKSSVHPRRHIN